MISLEQAKLHARIDSSDDESLVELLLSAAIDHCTFYLNRPIYQSELEKTTAEQTAPADSVTGVVITDDIRAAVLLTFGWLYENREDVGEKSSAYLPKNACWLLDKYRHCPGV